MAALREYLLGLPAVTALVSTRIYVKRPPQRPTHPHIVLIPISKVIQKHLRGATGPMKRRVQVESIGAAGESGVDARAVALAVSDAVDGDGLGSGFNGLSTTIGSPALVINGMFYEDGSDHERYDGDEFRTYTIIRDYMVHYLVM